MSRKLPSLHNFNFTMKKGRRMKNWTEYEKELLFALVEPHVDIIENKNAKMQEKTKLWKIIHSKLNKEGPSDRAVNRVRQQWHRMKVIAKLEMLSYHNKIKQVGLKNATQHQPSPLNIKIWRLCLASQYSACENEMKAKFPRIDEVLSSSLQHSEKQKLAISDDSMPGIKIEVTSDMETDEYDDYENEETQANEVVNKDEMILKENNLSLNQSHLPDENENKAIDPLADSAEDFIINSQQQHKSQNQGHQPSTQHFHKYPTQPSVGSVPQSVLIRQNIQDSSVYYLMNQREHNIKIELLKTQLEVAVLQRQTATHDLRAAAAKCKIVEEQALHKCHCQVKMVGERGSGAGKGGGGGGTIREAGGSFGKMEAAHEDQYFYNLQKEQLSKLREGLHDEISFHEEQIKRHQEAINRHKKRMEEMEKH